MSRFQPTLLQRVKRERDGCQDAMGDAAQGLERATSPRYRGPWLALPITGDTAREVAAQTGRPGPELWWAPTQPTTATFEALQQLDIGAPPFWYLYEYGSKTAGYQSFTLPSGNPWGPLRELLSTPPQAPESIIEVTRHSHAGAFSRYGFKGGGILYCRFYGSPSTGWREQFCNL